MAGESIRIHELLQGDSNLIENREFQDCEIIGPALIFPMDCTFDHCGWGGDPDAILWEIPLRRVTEIRSNGSEASFYEPTRKIGAIAVRNCTFRHCRFRGIGVAGPPALIQTFRQGVGEQKSYVGVRPSPTSILTQVAPVRPLKVFISYSHKDDVYRQRLEEYLAMLRNGQYVQDWNDRNISAGEDWRNSIDRNLEDADIILLLVSASFLASPYCYNIEFKRALERHKQGEARVIPIIVRECDWQQSPIGELQVLPDEGRPIANRADRAWTQVVKGLRKVIDEMQANLLP
jgi:TIR domain